MAKSQTRVVDELLGLLNEGAKTHVSCVHIAMEQAKGILDKAKSDGDRGLTEHEAVVVARRDLEIAAHTAGLSVAAGFLAIVAAIREHAETVAHATRESGQHYH